MYVVKEQVGDNPVYRIISEGDGKKLWVLHRNLFHLVNYLPVDLPITEENKTTPEKTKRRKPVKGAELQSHSGTSSGEDDDCTYYEPRYDLRTRKDDRGTYLCSLEEFSSC